MCGAMWKQGYRTLSPIVRTDPSGKQDRSITGNSEFIFEPPRGKTNNVVSEQVRHKQGCTSTEDG